MFDFFLRSPRHTAALLLLAAASSAGIGRAQASGAPAQAPIEAKATSSVERALLSPTPGPAAVSAGPRELSASRPVPTRALLASRPASATTTVQTSTPSPVAANPVAPSPVAARPIAAASNAAAPAPSARPVAVASGATGRGPAALAARSGTSDDALRLARLEADLLRAERKLDRASTQVSQGQTQLQSVVGILQGALAEGGADARGLHPFVRVAQRYIGTPYVWGGESARGFDCSGFIMRVMRDLGYRALPHSAAEQFRHGSPVARPDLRPGDLVFFANTYKPGVSHVGIFLGRGRFIHAANSREGTIISNLSEARWLEKYAGARRLVDHRPSAQRAR